MKNILIALIITVLVFSCDEETTLTTPISDDTEKLDSNDTKDDSENKDSLDNDEIEELVFTK